jgi:hypothetical protein
MREEIERRDEREVGDEIKKGDTKEREMGDERKR